MVTTFSCPSILNSIGNTPIIKLEKLNMNDQVSILAKIESFNPAGSIKDRMVMHIIHDAEKNGLLRPGGTIVENTSGNTGAAVAMIAAIKGYKAILTLPDKVSQEKINALKAYGAEIVICPTKALPTSPDHYVNTAIRIAKETPNSFRINQYDNPKNTEAHYLTTGPEIWEQTHGKIDYFVISASTGGTISGVGKYLKEKNPQIKIIMVDPIGSIYFHYFKTGKIPDGGNCNYQLEGIGEDHIAHAMNFSILDDVIQVTDKEAFQMGRRLAKEEGIFGGGSGGANVWGALEIAKKIRRPAVIVTIIPDAGIKYLSKMYNDEWMKNNQYL